MPVISAAWEAEIRRIAFQIQPKVSVTTISTIHWVWWQAPLIQAMQEAYIGRSPLRLVPSKK
jgi:hypothetical protein